MTFQYYDAQKEYEEFIKYLKKHHYEGAYLIDPKNEIIQSMIHELKIRKEYYEAILSGKKRFEIRKDDRPFREGDYLILKVYQNDTFTGEEITCKVSYIYRGELCKDEYCVMSVDFVGHTEMIR